MERRCGVEEVIRVPFAGYKDFSDCVAKNQDKDDPSAYCGEIKAKVEGKKEVLSPSEEEVITFLKHHPNPDDDTLHQWSELHGYSPHEVEEVVYRILTRKLKKKESVKMEKKTIFTSAMGQQIYFREQQPKMPTRPPQPGMRWKLTPSGAWEQVKAEVPVKKVVEPTRKIVKKPSGGETRQDFSNEAENLGLTGDDLVGYVEDRANGLSVDDALFNIRRVSK